MIATLLAIAGLGLFMWTLIRSPPATRTDAADDRVLAINKTLFDANLSLYSASTLTAVPDRFADSLAIYWDFHSCHCYLWDKGRWQRMDITGDECAPPVDVVSTARLPEPGERGTLMLDLSPAVRGQAVLVATGARSQPILRGLSARSHDNLAQALRVQMALALRRVVLVEELRQLSRIDPLTDCYRRWYGEQRLEEAIAAGNDDLSVCMIDIDHFKRINDEHGHAAGDSVLRQLGSLLWRQLRASDLPYRYGGEEFVLVLPHTSTSGAQVLCRRLQQSLAQESGLPCPVTASIGIAGWQTGMAAAELVGRADEAVYRAKHDGRNRIVIAEEPAP